MKIFILYFWMLGFYVANAQDTTSVVPVEEHLTGIDSAVQVNHALYNKDLYIQSLHLPKESYHPDKAILAAKQHVGTPYVVGGKQPGGFDCSGFMLYVHKYLQVYLPWFSSQYAQIGEEVLKADARKGDFILFKGHDIAHSEPGHVGLVVENKAGKLSFIHASTSHGVRIEFLDQNTYLSQRFLKIIRIQP
jgi:cell wall-associated NlpC family hydrolase